MKTRTTVLLILAALLFLGGATTAICAWMAAGCDISALNTTAYTHNTHIVEGSFDSIAINTTAAEVRFVISENDTCTVTCTESETMRYTITVQNGTLRINEKDERQWYEHIRFSFTARELIVAVPQADYRELMINAVSSDILLPDTFRIGSAALETVSGDIDVAATVAVKLSATSMSGDIAVSSPAVEALKLKSTSGDITVTSPTVGTLQAESTSGDLTLSHIACSTLTASTTSGDIHGDAVTALGMITLQGVSGNIELERCDGAALSLKTTSGNIEATLLSSKQFTTDTVSGNVHVAPSAGVEPCDIETTSGNITIEIEG